MVREGGKLKYLIFIGGKAWNNDGNGDSGVYDYWPGAEKLIPLDSSMGFVNANTVFTLMIRIINALNPDGTQDGYMNPKPENDMISFPASVLFFKGSNDQTMVQNVWEYVNIRGGSNKAASGNDPASVIGKGFSDYMATQTVKVSDTSTATVTVPGFYNVDLEDLPDNSSGSAIENLVYKDNAGGVVNPNPTLEDVTKGKRYIEIRDLFQRNPVISMLYLRIYLDFLKP